MKLIFTLSMIWVLTAPSLYGQISSDYLYFFQNSIPYHYQKNKKTGNNCVEAQPNRSPNGSCNNMNEQNWGQAINPFSHRLMPDYGANGAMAGENRGSARMISNYICHQDAGESVESQRGLSSLVYTFFQFIDHNITATAEGHTEFKPIPIPMSDPFFDPNGTGSQMMPFMRSETMMSDNGMLSPINMLSSWIDGAGIYGSDETRANWLRTFENGKLKISENNLLPCNTTTGFRSDPIDTLAPAMAGDKNRCGVYQKVFVAGDIRANEQPGLLSLHTVFMREHNRLCNVLVLEGMTDDEAIYQKAKRIVVGELQAIVYQELLPALGVHLGEYRGYNHQIQPDISNVFATAAFRLGHTMVDENLILIDNNCQPINGNTGCGPADGDCSCTNANVGFGGTLDIKNAFFHPSLVSNIGVEPILKGLTSQTQQEIDAKVISSLRNFLFGAPGSGGLDLAALNIQRGRDHGLPDYNTIRQHFIGNSVNSFAEITNKVNLQTALATAYNNDFNNIDAFVGLLAEDHLPNTSVGATLHAILKDQFTRLRESDRYFYKIDPMLSPMDKKEVQQTTLADLLTRNTNLVDLPSQAFYARSCSENRAIQLIVKDESGRLNDYVEIPVLVDNFKNVYQITADFQWDNTALEFDQVLNFAISEGVVSFQNTLSSLHVDWSYFQNAGKTLAQGDTLFLMRFKILNNTIENVAIEANTSFSASSAGVAPTWTVPSFSKNGVVNIQTSPNHFNITGIVATPTGYPTQDLQVNFIKNNQLPSYFYINNGQTTFEKNIAAIGADFEFYVQTTSVDCPFAHKLSVLDAILLQEHLENIRPFEQAYSFLAADTDDNNMINQNDLDELMAILLRQSPHFPNDNYRFFSTERYPTLADPFDIETKRRHTNIQEYLYAQNFMGVPKGRIKEMDNFPLEEQPSYYNSKQIDQIVLKNEIIEIPILAQDAETWRGLQLTLNWDASVLDFINIRSNTLTNFSDYFIDNQSISDGELAIVWQTLANQAANFANGDTLMVLQFIVSGNRGDATVIEINDNIKKVMAVTGDLKVKYPIFDTHLIKVIENFEGVENPFQLVVFPNPASSFVQLQFQLDLPSQLVEIELFTTLGQSIFKYENNYPAGVHQFKLEELPLETGCYFVKFETGNEVVTQRFLVK